MSEKKSLPFLVLEILKRFSCKDSPLTKSRIAKLLINEYDRECDARTIDSALTSLLGLGYPIYYSVLPKTLHKTNWYIEPDFDAELQDKLLLSLICSRYVSKRDIQNIKERVFLNSSSVKTLNGIRSYTNETSVAKKIIQSINVIFKAIQDNYMLYFSVIEYKTENKIHLKESNNQVIIYLAKPIEVVAFFDEIYLFCEMGDTGIYRFFKVENLYMLEINKAKFERIEVAEMPYPRNKLESTSPSFNNREKAVLRLKNDSLNEISELLGSEWQILYKYDSKTEISVVANLRLLKRYVLSLGTSVEVLSPTKLRRSVGTELRETAAKYNEIRKLRGQL